MVSEIVYYNNGSVYKKQTQAEIKKQYDFSNGSTYSKEGKVYIPSKEALAMFKPFDPVSKESYYLIDQLPFPLTYDKNLMGIGYSSKDNSYEVYIGTYSEKDLEDVVYWSKQIMPVTEKQKKEMYSDIENHCFGVPFTHKPFILVSVKLTNLGVPYMCKLYDYVKVHKGWMLWMSGTSYVNGKVLEQGQVMSRVFWGMYDKLKESPQYINIRRSPEGLYKSLEIILSKLAGNNVVYKYVSGTVMNWRADIYDNELNLVDTKYFRPSNFLKRFISNDSNKDNDYTFLATTPAIDYWLGDAYYTNSDVKEYFFGVTRGSSQIEQVAAHYKLALPYDEVTKKLLDTKPEALRVKYLDLLLAGEGKAVPVVVCSLLVKDNKPFSLVLYKFDRPFEEDADFDYLKDRTIFDTIIDKDTQNVNDTN